MTSYSYGAPNSPQNGNQDGPVRDELPDLARPVTQWFSHNARTLPWRATGTTAWGVLVSEIMLQQTPVARVEPIWPAWMRRWPTPAEQATATPADVLQAWGTLGYPRSALRLREAALAICADHAGQVPTGHQELISLPGVGSYTAAAVRTFAFGLRDVVLDTNVRRVIARAVSGEALPAPHLSAAESVLAARLVPGDAAQAAAWNAAAMELGALVCTAAAPRCDLCPIASQCRWILGGRPPDRWAQRRRTQPWHGTDRQVRGRIMAVLRTQGTAQPAELPSLGADAQQLQRCIESLIRDGLVRRGPAGSIALPR